MRTWESSVGGKANAAPDVMSGHLQEMKMAADIIARIQQKETANPAL
jgi:hypothetical protein